MRRLLIWALDTGSHWAFHISELLGHVEHALARLSWELRTR